MTQLHTQLHRALAYARRVLEGLEHDHEYGECQCCGVYQNEAHAPGCEWEIALGRQPLPDDWECKPLCKSCDTRRRLARKKSSAPRM